MKLSVEEEPIYEDINNHLECELSVALSVYIFPGIRILIWKSQPIMFRRRGRLCFDYDHGDAHFTSEQFGRHHAVHVAQMTIQTTPCCCVAAQAAPKIIFLVKINMREGKEGGVVVLWRLLMVDNVGCVPAPTGHVPCCLHVSASEQRDELIRPAT